MNQQVFQGDDDWGSTAEDDAKAKILQAWAESNEKPGAYLKQLRELQNRDVNEMASELGLSVSQLIALENDDQEELPAPIYVKNYIKRYCMCLGISENEISGVLDEMGKNVIPELNRVSIQESGSSRQLITRLVRYVMIGLLIALLFFGIKSLDISELWESISSSSSNVEPTATELSLPVIVEDDEVDKTQPDTSLE
jgi:cytoskeleton protein RodZ